MVFVEEFVEKLSPFIRDLRLLLGVTLSNPLMYLTWIVSCPPLFGHLNVLPLLRVQLLV
jgi:hypothetical protein